MSMIIGIDFDNTIISYDALIHTIAVEQKLIKTDHVKHKKAIRDTIRKQPNGDIKWQEIQALIYGPRIHEAQLMLGVKEFLAECTKRGIKTVIISHKTQQSSLYQSRSQQGTNFHDAAREWLKNNLPEINEVFFEETREKKIERIKQQRCTHFIDDLEEVFLEQSFPPDVKKILFQSSEAMHKWIRASDWLEAKLFLVDITNVSAVQRMSGGKNSRVYKVQRENDNKPICVKFYVEQARAEKEFAALSFLWDNGMRQISQPLQKGSRFVIIDFIDGKKIEEITETEIKEAVMFLKKLFELKAKAQHIPNAAEACFSIKGIIQNIESRRTKLNNIEKASQFLHDFDGVFAQVVQRCKEMCIKQNISFETEISSSEKTLSPSDFGFHNALKRDNKIIFLDFEYFGWDDPAKMIADFMLHPAMSLNKSQKDIFTAALQLPVPNLTERVKIVQPLFALKWFIIMLNEFLPNTIRTFAVENLNKEQSQREQLDKANTLLQRIKNEL